MFKKAFKKIIPSSVVMRVRKLIDYRLIKNIYKRDYKRKVLISYVTEPFRKKSLNHTVFFEASVAARIFDELGFVVDIMHCNAKKPKLEQYDVIYGFGDVFRFYFESGFTHIKTIRYSPGMHPNYCNVASLNRVRDVYTSRGKWLTKSARVNIESGSHETTLVDGIIALGNYRCKETYESYYKGTVIALNAPYFQVIEDVEELLFSRGATTRNNYLWFGSSGLIHKGLDLCLEFFKRHPLLNLHICGNIYLEKDFVNEFSEELFCTSNIHVHGFVDIQSEGFKKILSQCSFCVFPSCSEGGGAAVLTAVGNGGLVPLISRDSSVSTGFEIFIETLDLEGLNRAILKSQELSEQELLSLQLNNYYYVKEQNSLNKYEVNLKSAIVQILKA